MATSKHACGSRAQRVVSSMTTTQTPIITLYGTTLCGFCSAARRLLDAKGISYDYIAVDTDAKLRAEIVERSGQRTVPQIWIGDVHVGGYSDLASLERDQKLDDLLLARG